MEYAWERRLAIVQPDTWYLEADSTLKNHQKSGRFINFHRHDQDDSTKIYIKPVHYDLTINTLVHMLVTRPLRLIIQNYSEFTRYRIKNIKFHFNIRYTCILYFYCHTVLKYTEVLFKSGCGAREIDKHGKCPLRVAMKLGGSFVQYAV
ncbi:hypothetical protein T4B_2593 [Trichinella pseudospiralis]|uniref:Uncharacterized protein n=1 Tax=Trichinella pseudospiralis TaxID=6337 RepID=A0A0V1IXF3_TRIPS|nr:hypothetical protein T4B_2593 [Trichinella pseudospiralis]